MEKSWKVILAFLGVFVAGAIFGGFFSLGMGRRIWEMEAPPAKPVLVSVPPQSPPAQPPPPPGKGGEPRGPEPQDVQRAQLMRRVANHLNLTPAQKNLVNPIIQRAVQDIWRQQQNFFRETAFITQRMKQDIARELTPDQQKKLDDLWQTALEQFHQRQIEAQARRQAEAQSSTKPASSPVAAPAPKPPGPDAATKVPASDAKDPKDGLPLAAKPPGGDRN